MDYEIYDHVNMMGDGLELIENIQLDITSGPSSLFDHFVNKGGLEKIKSFYQQRPDFKIDGMRAWVLIGKLDEKTGETFECVTTKWPVNLTTAESLTGLELQPVEDQVCRILCKVEMGLNVNFTEKRYTVTLS